MSQPTDGGNKEGNTGAIDAQADFNNMRKTVVDGLGSIADEIAKRAAAKNLEQKTAEPSEQKAPEPEDQFKKSLEEAALKKFEQQGVMKQFADAAKSGQYIVNRQKEKGNLPKALQGNTLRKKGTESLMEKYAKQDVQKGTDLTPPPEPTRPKA